MRIIAVLIFVLGLLVVAGVYVLFFLELSHGDKILQLLYIMRSTGLVIIVGAALGMLALTIDYLFRKTISWLEKNDDEIC